MERLFKIKSVFHTTIKGKSETDPERPKVEITLCYHETYYNSQTGPGIRPQYIQIVLLDDKAQNCTLKPGYWIVGSVNLTAYDSRTEAGRMNEQHYLDRYVPIADWNVL